MAIETDYKCQFQKPLGCENQEAQGFQDLSILQGCFSVADGSDDVMNETCTWKCEMGRPVARCVYRFDPNGVYQEANYGSLQECWIQPTCWGSSRVEVRVACRPDELWKDASSLAAQLAAARANLTQVQELLALMTPLAQNASVLTNLLSLERAQQRNISQVLFSGRASQNTTLEVLQSVFDQMEIVLAHLEEAADSDMSVNASLQDLKRMDMQREVASREMLALIKQLIDITRQQPRGSEAQQAAAQHLANAQRAYKLLQQVQERSIKLRQQLKDDQNRDEERSVLQNRSGTTQKADDGDNTDDGNGMVTLLLVLVIVLAVIVVVQLFAVVVMVRKKKKASPPMPGSGAPQPSPRVDEGTAVVVGRPVDGGSTQPSPRAASSSEDGVEAQSKDTGKPHEGTTVTRNETDNRA